MRYKVDFFIGWGIEFLVDFFQYIKGVFVIYIILLKIKKFILLYKKRDNYGIIVKGGLYEYYVFEG